MLGAWGSDYNSANYNVLSTTSLFRVINTTSTVLEYTLRFRGAHLALSGHTGGSNGVVGHSPSRMDPRSNFDVRNGPMGPISMGVQF